MEYDAANVRLNGYKGFWGFGSVGAPQQLQLLQISCRTAKYYLCVALDLQTLVLLPLQPEYVTLLDLLRFHYFAMRTTQTTATTGPAAAAADNTEQQFWLHSLNIWLNLLQGTLLQLMNSATVPSFPPPAGKAAPWVQVPNGQVLESFVYCKYMAQSNDQKPAYLRTFPSPSHSAHDNPLTYNWPEDMKQLLLHGSTLREFSAQSIETDPCRETGLPIVLFVCMGHRTATDTPRIVAACSGDNWLPNQNLHKVSRKWREARMPNIADAKTALETMGRRVVDRFNSVKARIVQVAPHASDATFNERMYTNQFSDAEFNEFVTAMYDDNNETYGPTNVLVAPFGNNHLSEPGRSFRGSGPHIFEEMSRCWKCRFVAQYQDDYSNAHAHAAALVQEDPRQTLFAANEPLSCAEDMCHLLCLGAGHLIAATPPWPNQPYFPFHQV